MLIILLFRCTDGILFVVDSVDVERMEEAKMELMRTAKCPDNQGVPVLILANKQDLPGARNPKELEKLLGLHELLYPSVHLQNIHSSSSPTGNIVGCTSSASNTNTFSRSLTPTSQHSKSFGYGGESGFCKEGITTATVVSSDLIKTDRENDLNDEISTISNIYASSVSSTTQDKYSTYESSPLSMGTIPTAIAANTLFLQKKTNKTASYSAALHQFKGWYIQPACAITGEGLQEGLEALYEMIEKTVMFLCTDGILFVVDSVDVERMEEAKMELMRTAKCPDNQGVPVLILANKQDLPGARNPKELEKLLGLHELLYPSVHLQNIHSSSSLTGNIVGCTSSASNTNTFSRSLTPTSQHSKSFGYGGESGFCKEGITTATVVSSDLIKTDRENDLNDEISTISNIYASSVSSTTQDKYSTYESYPLSMVTIPTAIAANTLFLQKKTNKTASYSAALHQFKGWYIQPACAITGEGLQEGLEALYEMILKRRKLKKTFKKKR